jgi:hypothetical protein
MMVKMMGRLFPRTSGAFGWENLPSSHPVIWSHHVQTQSGAAMGRDAAAPTVLSSKMTIICETFKDNGGIRQGIRDGIISPNHDTHC